MKGTISCQCGEVTLTLGEATPRARLQCGCCDCRQAMAWAQLQGGPTVPTLRPLDLYYFGNDFAFASGKNKTKWYKLRENGRVRFWLKFKLHVSGMYKY